MRSSRELGYYPISVVRGVAFFEIEIDTEDHPHTILNLL